MPLVTVTMFAGLLQAAAPAPASAACELHVWPAADMTRVRQRGSESTVVGGGALEAAIGRAIKQSQEAQAEKHDANVAQALAASETPEPMSTATQVSILQTLSLPEMLGLPGYRTVLHDTPLESRTIRTVKTRYVETAAPCYADLVLDDVVYSREYARGQNLKTFFRFRDFGSDGAPARSFGTWVQTKLTLFSIDPPNMGAPALDEIASALRSNAAQFSGLLAKRQTTASNH